MSFLVPGFSTFSEIRNLVETSGNPESERWSSSIAKTAQDRQAAENLLPQRLTKLSGYEPTNTHVKVVDQLVSGSTGRLSLSSINTNKFW